MSLTAFQKTKAVRSNGRPTATDYINKIFDDFIELHGDRYYSDDRAIIGGIAMLDDMPVTVVGIEKGKTIEERIASKSGSPHPDGYRKSLRLMKQAEKFNRPVICFVDTGGAYCGIDAEERGQGRAIAENLMEMMVLKTPVLSIFIGEGGSGGALALGVADEVWMLENAVYSVISPEGCASILWKDVSMAGKAAELLKITAQDSLENDLIERIISEDYIGEDSFYKAMHKMISEKIKQLKDVPLEELIEERYSKYREIGR